MRRFLCLFIIIISIFSVFATSNFINEPIASVDNELAYPFARVELLLDAYPAFTKEEFHEKNRLSHPTLLELTGGNAEPSSGYFFLHYSPNWDKADPDKNPVLLIHGAGDTAFRAWAHPFKFYVKPGEEIQYKGLALTLADKGYSVFSITFVHPHGDNFMQSEQIANAISRIKKVLHREGDPTFQVDIIAHSKGGVAARMYLSDIREEYSEYSWLTPYRKDVRRFMSLSTPLKGVDTAYRYYGMNLYIVQDDTAAPMGADKLLYYGMWRDFQEHNDMFPGQYQLLHDFVNDNETSIPLSNLSATPFDMNYSRNVLYNGGVSGTLVSSGIKSGIKKGKDLINKLNQKGMDPSVELVVVAGNDNLIKDDIEYFVDLFPMGEDIAPSDSLLFVESATYTKGILRRGAKLIDKVVIPYNHMNITFHHTAKDILIHLLEE
ncbi:MAG: hypothetical protein C0601_05645 [Candidatus Muiribacterium halophilum]|uniref:DUF676 domain-containing protein n=1 Tax=Muiribacterium halophilum TaxID=2053465 RepID=A0A2N5ZHA6_MUIH1|nr:MAG: hypothetical protein C0601_05645 [Candidatus Muirbacterium halophilum]